MSDEETAPRLCFACGPANERGLHMEFPVSGDPVVKLP